MENLSRPGWWFEGRKDGQPSAQPWNPQLTLHFHPSILKSGFHVIFIGTTVCFVANYPSVQLFFLMNCVFCGGLGLTENRLLFLLLREFGCASPPPAFPPEHFQGDRVSRDTVLHRLFLLRLGNWTLGFHLARFPFPAFVYPTWIFKWEILSFHRPPLQ